MTVVRVEGVPLVDDVVVRWPATAGWTAALTLDDGEHRAAGPATPGAEPREGGRASSAVGPAAGRERGGRGWLTVTGTTAPAAERAGRDVVVLLDRSGSMGGWQMGAARDVARAIVERLGSSDRLCVLAFDTELATVPGAVGFAAAAPAHRRKVQEWLTTVEARGGTELTRAFVTAAGLVAGSDRATIVIVTDAEIGDEDRCLAAIRMADADVLTVGVGGRVNRGLITAIADTSGGWSTIVESPERLEDAVGDIARRCAGEALRIEQVTVGGADRVEWSGPHPRLVAGHQTVLRAEVEGMPTTVTVSGPGYRTIVPVSTGGPAAAHPLWARARVAELLRAEGREADALRIALDGSVLCRLTAFVAVDPSGRQLDAVPTRVEVGHLGGAGRGGAPMVKLAMPAAAPMAARARTFVPPPPMAVSPAGAPPTPDRQPAPSPGSAASTAPARFEALVAEIAARDGLTVDAAERSRLLGDWAERVAEFLTGDDAPTAKSLAAALAAAIVGSDDAWTRLIAWCVRAGRS